MADTSRTDSDGGTRRVGEPTVYTTPPTTALGEPTLGELITDLSEDFSTLVRKEIKLAKVETMESVSKASRSVIMLAAGGMVAYAGLILVLIGLAVLIGQALDSLWLGALLVGVIVVGIGGILLSSGRSGLKNISITPEKTIETLKDDARWAKEQVS